MNLIQIKILKEKMLFLGVIKACVRASCLEVSFSFSGAASGLQKIAHIYLKMIIS